MGMYENPMKRTYLITDETVERMEDALTAIKRHAKKNWNLTPAAIKEHVDDSRKITALGLSDIVETALILALTDFEKDKFDSELVNSIKEFLRNQPYAPSLTLD